MEVECPTRSQRYRVFEHLPQDGPPRKQTKKQVETSDMWWAFVTEWSNTRIAPQKNKITLTIDNRSCGFPVPAAPGFIKTIGRPTRSRLLSNRIRMLDTSISVRQCAAPCHTPTFATAEKYPGSRQFYHAHHVSPRAVYLDSTIQAFERDVIWTDKQFRWGEVMTQRISRQTLNTLTSFENDQPSGALHDLGWSVLPVENKSSTTEHTPYFVPSPVACWNATL